MCWLVVAVIIGLLPQPTMSCLAIPAHIHTHGMLAITREFRGTNGPLLTMTGRDDAELGTHARRRAMYPDDSASPPLRQLSTSTTTLRRATATDDPRFRRVLARFGIARTPVDLPVISVDTRQCVPMSRLVRLVPTFSFLLRPWCFPPSLKWTSTVCPLHNQSLRWARALCLCRRQPLQWMKFPQFQYLTLRVWVLGAILSSVPGV